MAYTPVFFGLSAAFCWGTADYLSRMQSEKVGSYKTVVYSHLVTLIILLGIIPFLNPSLSVPPLAGIALLGAGIFNFVAFIFLYRAFHKGVVSVVAPVAYTYPAVTAVLSVIILGTVITSVSVVAISAIILGVVLLSTRFSEVGAYFGGKGSPNFTAGLGAAVGSSLFFGLVYLGVGYAAPLVSFVLPAVFLRTVGVAAGFLLAPALRQSVMPSKLTFSKILLAMGFLEAVGFLTFTYGITAGGGSVPVVTAISGMGAAFATGYAMVFLKERLETNQLVGVCFSLAGVFALLYLG